MMVALDDKFPQFGFAGHKGYGSASHLAAIKEHGPCEHHRPTYAPVAEVLADS
jgi:ribonuclease HII